METNWPPMELRGPVVFEADVATFERQLGRTLPDDYRRFLLEVNGGRTERSHRRFSEGNLNGLFSLNETEHETRDLATRAERERKHLPHEDLLFVGYDGVGGQLFVMLSGDHRGEVWHQAGSDARPSGSNPRVAWHDRRNMKKLADGWSAFMAALRPLS